METKEKELLDAIKGQVTELVEGKAKMTAEAIEVLKKELATVTEKSSDTAAIKSEVEKIATALKAMQEEAKGAKSKAKKSLATALVDGYLSLAKDSNNFEKLEKGARLTMEVKAAGTMTTTNVVPSVATAPQFSLSEFETGLTRIVRRKPFIFELVNLGSTSKAIVQWAEQTNPDPGAAGNTAEGAAKTQTDFDVQEAFKKVEKITAYIKVSKEMLDDLSYIEGEIRTELIELVTLRMDAQILSGNGTSPQLSGILGYAQTWAAGTFALTIENANNFDVIRVAINQIEKENFMPNYIVMHPTDVAAMDMAKDSTGQYVMPPFITAGGNTIKGLPIITNTGVVEGDFLVGDFSKSNVRVRENAAISVGYENDDFTKNLVTILCEMRGVHYVKANHVDAFVTGTFSTAITALEKP